MDLKVTTAIALVLIFAVSQGAALQCHVSAAMNEETGTDAVVTCNGSCAYSEQTVSGMPIFMQTCMPVTVSEACVDDDHVGFQICYCNTELCNAESGTSGTSGLGSLLVTWLLSASIIVGGLCYV